jgi:hypothetical protein
LPAHCSREAAGFSRMQATIVVLRQQDDLVHEEGAVHAALE